MKLKYLLTVIILLKSAFTFGQDGSDIEYVKTKDLNNSYVGKFAHLDFYNRSWKALKLDTISLNVNNNRIIFIESRADNGYNNWFSQQFLESIDNINGLKLRVEKCQINKISEDSILVTNYYNFYNSKYLPLLEKSFKQDYWFSKSIIAEVLISSH